jgi:hypothetical protein
MSRRASWLPLAIVAIPVLGPALPAQAWPTLDLSWSNCSPIVSTRFAVPGQPISTLFCSATGMDSVHTGYVVKLWFATEMTCRAETSTPDAWRFDTPGCQSGLAQVDFTGRDPACPQLSGPLPPALTLVDFEYSPPFDDLWNYTAVCAMRLTTAVAYPNAPQTPDPAQRYHLLAIRFDHTHSVPGAGTPGVTCGGYDRSVCLALWSGMQTAGGYCLLPRPVASSFVSDGIEYPFQIGQGFASFGLDPATSFSCFEVVPARSATWGAIKAQYR